MSHEIAVDMIYNCWGFYIRQNVCEHYEILSIYVTVW